MQHYRSLDEAQLDQSWLTIGSFDGVHRGHQAILRRLVAGSHSAGLPAVVLTFYPHPSVILRNREGPFYLTSPDERARLLSECGVDIVITHPFSRELSNLSAPDFLERVHNRLNPVRLLIGPNFALGRNREGNVSRLVELGADYNYSLEVIEPVQFEGTAVSSSLIRAFLTDGDISKANNLLGRAYQLSGKVVHGDGRGRFLGIPTANMEIWKAQILPKNGVYLCQAWIAGQLWKAVTNIGTRPTFSHYAEVPKVEAHVLDFDTDIYDNEITLKFIRRLRDEQRFPDLNALIAQIETDIREARQA